MAPRYTIENLPFKIRGKLPPLCRFVVIKWCKNSSSTRTLVSCHKKRSTAKVAQRSLKSLEKNMSQLSKIGLMFLPSGYKKDRVGVFDLISGKQVTG